MRQIAFVLENLKNTRGVSSHTLSLSLFLYACFTAHVLTPTMLFNSVTVICFALSTAEATCC